VSRRGRNIRTALRSDNYVDAGCQGTLVHIHVKVSFCSDMEIDFTGTQPQTGATTTPGRWRRPTSPTRA